MAAAAFAAEAGTDKELKLRIRPWTQNPILRRRREREVHTPAVDTYSQHMEKAHLLHKRLKLKDSQREAWTCTFVPRKSPRANSLHFPRSHTFMATRRAKQDFPPVPRHSLVENGRKTTKTGDKSANFDDEIARFRDVSADLGDKAADGGDVTAENGDVTANFGDVLNREISVTSEILESETQTSLHPHPHRPQALSHPLPSSTASGSFYQQANGKSNHVEHRQLWAFPRSKTEFPFRSSWKQHTPPSQLPQTDYAMKSSLNPFSPTAPLNGGCSGAKWVKDADESTTSGVGSSASGSDEDEVYPDPSATQTGSHPKKRRKVNIIQLCEHLKTHGLGEPVMSTSSHVPSTTRLPPGVKARRLPRDPSTREKIKGRARLDYELANLKAVAFCEQQHPRTFRTASANLKNRDVRLLEEEEREQIHRDLHDNDVEGQLEGQDEDASSLVGSPLSREELFSRIEAWEEEVQRALQHHHAYHRQYEDSGPSEST